MSKFMVNSHHYATFETLPFLFHQGFVKSEIQKSINRSITIISTKKGYHCFIVEYR